MEAHARRVHAIAVAQPLSAPHERAEQVVPLDADARPDRQAHVERLGADVRPQVHEAAAGRARPLATKGAVDIRPFQ